MADGSSRLLYIADVMIKVRHLTDFRVEFSTVRANSFDRFNLQATNGRPIEIPGKRYACSTVDSRTPTLWILVVVYFSMSIVGIDLLQHHKQLEVSGRKYIIICLWSLIF